MLEMGIPKIFVFEIVSFHSITTKSVFIEFQIIKKFPYKFLYRNLQPDQLRNFLSSIKAKTTEKTKNFH